MFFSANPTDAAGIGAAAAYMENGMMRPGGKPCPFRNNGFGNVSYPIQAMESLRIASREVRNKAGRETL